MARLISPARVQEQAQPVVGYRFESGRRGVFSLSRNGLASGPQTRRTALGH